MAPATQSHKRKPQKPQLVVGSTVSATSHTTLDNRRVRTRISTLSQAATPASTISEEFWADDLPTNEARHSTSFSYQLGDESLEPQTLDLTDDGITVQIHNPASSKKTYRPLQEWWPKIDEYLAENLRREGRGAQKNYARCPGPDCPDTRLHQNHAGCDGAPEWRCVDQACFGEQLYCSECIVEMHKLHPTHFVEKWNGTHFVRRRTWLQELGLVIQLGHPPGVVCPYGESAAHDFVLYDLSGVHELSVRFCGCRSGEDNERTERRVQLLRACWWPATVHLPNTCVTFGALRLFQLLNCLGKLSAYDFLRGLELFTSNDGLDTPPVSLPFRFYEKFLRESAHCHLWDLQDRRRPFMCVMRQWREVKRHKRAKRGHAEGGVFATGQGELALQCRACPQPGWNLPEGWENIDPFFRFLYCVFLAVDANFRLSNRDVSSEAADPLMGDGWGYFCKRYGEDGYNAHVAKHANEEELSNCSGFQAISQANSRRTRGLRATGVVGVICGRHNMWRANGVGDLQIGERQCNVDYVVLSAVLSFALLLLIISYDIACQYSVNFWRRMHDLPSRLHLKLREQDVWWKIPNFHLPAHKRKCHSL
ncbi:hypothetical protein R3P38DRAFT_2551217 [Favolaschia claudopus]|uniref:CxC2-like cysteine cluster KDZ transposase-associated domain-containing protein n=1 Tax=Favolaschia claudopus TaxID=2862362 RepID=A0AAW0AHB6_9AGAR